MKKEQCHICDGKGSVGVQDCEKCAGTGTLWDGRSPKEGGVLNEQVGGDHFRKHGAYQPWEVLRRWLTPEEMRGYMKGSAIVYLARERDKNGDEDIAKAEHYLKAMRELRL